MIQLFSNLTTNLPPIGMVQQQTDYQITDIISSQNPLEALNSWSSNTNKLMDLVMKTTHLINKEEMVHKHLAGGAASTD